MKEHANEVSIVVEVRSVRRLRHTVYDYMRCVHVHVTSDSTTNDTDAHHSPYMLRKVELCIRRRQAFVRIHVYMYVHHIGANDHAVNQITRAEHASYKPVCP